MRAAKAINAGAWVLVALPAAALAARALFGGEGLGANPAEALTHVSGEWALRFLILSLAITPLRKLGGARAARLVPLPLRRTFGLGAFAYAAAHFLTYLALDLGFGFAHLAEDILERPYIAVGFAAFVPLLLLAATSTKGWQKRLRRRWNTLHKLVYPAALLAAAHFVWLKFSKSDTGEAAVYAGIIALLLLLRIFLQWRAGGKRT